MTGRALVTLMLAACCAHAVANPAPAAPAAAAPQAAPTAPLSSTPAAETPTEAPAAAPAPAAPSAPAAVTPRREPLVTPVPSSSGPSAVNLLQTIFGLVVVLALLAGLAWFLKRFGPKNATGSADLRIVGALNLGGRERIVVVEVGDQWIVVGASPGRVNALATLPRQQAAAPVPGAYAPSATSFSEWLKQTIDKRK
jgi:flagellar protein FliO/FliZ